MTSLAFLHCLPVCFRTDCKSLLISIKDLHGLPPAYTSHLLLPYEPVCILRAMGRVFRGLAENEKRAFEVRAWGLCNNLPKETGSVKSVVAFKLSLKTCFLLIIMNCTGH